MRKRLFVALALLTLTAFGPQAASAQLPGGLKIPKIGKPKPKPAPGETAQPQPGAPAATNTAAPEAAPGPQAEGITLTKTLIRFWPYTVNSYEGNFDVWSWFPTVKITTAGGPLPSGGQYYVEVAQPSGAAWIKLKCVNTTHGGPTFECGDRNDLEKSGTLATGVFPFVVKMRNPLEGTEQTLFSGKAKVEKVLSNEHGPKAVKKFVYYANQDWNLPIGQVYIGDDDHLNVRFWIRGEGAGGLKAHPMYRGEEVGLYAEHGYQYGGASCSPDIEYQPTRSAGAGAPQGAKWARVNCKFTSVVTKPSKNTPQWHGLGTNPGEYEIKVLRNNRLARSIKFSIGPDGKIVDNRIAANSGMGTWNNHIFVPVTVIGDQDGTWDKNAWKTEAFYGHPLTGFNWPPQ